MDRAERLQYILDVIASDPHVTRGELEIDLTLSEYLRAIEKGDDSVENVIGVLEGIGFVTGIRITEAFSEEDHDGKDLVLDIEGEEFYVQVKSGYAAVKAFIAEGGELGILLGKFIVLNGQNTHEVIEVDFMRQLIDIDKCIRQFGGEPVLSESVKEEINRRLKG